MYDKSIALLLPLLGGGTTRHASEMAYAWSLEKYNVLFVEVYQRIISVKVYSDGCIQDKYILLVENELDLLKKILASYNTVLLHVHHVLNFDADLINIHKTLDIPLILTLHDYYMLCPYIQLTTENGMYCGELGETECAKCLFKRPYYGNVMQKEIYNIKKWRCYWHNYLLEAALIIVPSKDVKNRYLKYFNDIKIKVIENPEVIPAKIYDNKAKLINENTDHNIRIGLIGILSKSKGADVLYNCAIDAKNRKLPIQFYLFGDLADKDNKKNNLDNVHILGRYDENKVYSLIQENKIDFFWFPNLWPETYSYTLTIPIRLKIPVVGTDLGAIGQRIKEHEWGITYKFNLSPLDINDILLKFDAKKYIQQLDNFNIENICFPSVEEYYGSILQYKKVTVIDKTAIVMLKEKVIVEFKNSKLKNLTGYEINMIMHSPATIPTKINFIGRIDFNWFMKYFQLHSFKYILKRISQL